MRLNDLSIVFVFLICLNCSDASTSDVSCLKVKLHDAFGDGWGKALWYYETPGAEETGYSAPNCTAKLIEKNICGGKDGFYFFVVQADEVPENSWEIRWTVEIEKTGLVFTGGFNTSLVFDYDKDASSFRIVYWHNMWSNTMNMTACGYSSSVVGGGSCQPSPSAPNDHMKPSDPKVLVRPKNPKPTSSPVSAKMIGIKHGKRRLDQYEDSKSVTDAMVDNSTAGHDMPNLPDIGDGIKAIEIREYRMVKNLQRMREYEDDLVSGNSTEMSSNSTDDSGEGDEANKFFESLVKARRARRVRKGVNSRRRGKLLKSGEEAEEESEDFSNSNATMVYSTEADEESYDDYTNSTEISNEEMEESVSIKSGIRHKSHNAHPRKRIRMRNGKMVYVEGYAEGVEGSDGNSTDEESASFLSDLYEAENVTNSDGSGGDGVDGVDETSTQPRRRNPVFRTIINRRERSSPTIITSSETSGGEGRNETLMYGNDSSSSMETSAVDEESSKKTKVNGNSGGLLKGLTRRYKSSTAAILKALDGGGGGGGGEGGEGNETYPSGAPTGMMMMTDFPSGMPTLMPIAMMDEASNFTVEGDGSGGGSTDKTPSFSIKTRSKDLVRKIFYPKGSTLVMSGGSDSGGSDSGDYNSTDVPTGQPTGHFNMTSGGSGGGSEESEHDGATVPITTRTRVGSKLINTKSPFSGKIKLTSGVGTDEIFESDNYSLLSDSSESLAGYRNESQSESGSNLIGGREQRQQPNRMVRTRMPFMKRDGHAHTDEDGMETGNSTAVLSDFPSGMPTAHVDDVMYYNETESDENGHHHRNPETGGLFRGQQSKRRYGDHRDHNDEDGMESSDMYNTTNIPSYEPTFVPSELFEEVDGGLEGSANGNSGGLLKGTNVKRTRKHSNHHSGTDYPTGFPSTMPSENMTVVMFDDVDSEAQSSASSKSVQSVPEKKKLGRNKHKHTQVAKGYASTLLRVEMFESHGNGWFRSNYEGIGFYISDETKTELLAWGMLENGTYSGYCDSCFDDGSYYFRVTSPLALGISASWSFCHTVGQYGQQLAFHIKDGECIPDALLDVDMICESTYSTVVTLQGTLAVAGVASEAIDSSSVWVLTTALAESVTGWDDSAVYVSKTSLNGHAIALHSRALSSFTYDVDFEVTFVTEVAYDIDGTSFYGVVGLVEELKDELNALVDAGGLANTIRNLALSTGATAMDDVYGVALLDLSVQDIMYLGTKEMTFAVAEDLTESTSKAVVTNTVYNVIYSDEFIPFVCMVVVGFVSFVGVVAVSLKLRVRSATHDSVDDDSLHSESEMSNHKLQDSRSVIRIGAL